MSQVVSCLGFSCVRSRMLVLMFSACRLLSLGRPVPDLCPFVSRNLSFSLSVLDHVVSSLFRISFHLRLFQTQLALVPFCRLFRAPQAIHCP